MQKIQDDKLALIDEEISKLEVRYGSFKEERENLLGNYRNCNFYRLKFVVEESCKINQELRKFYQEKQKAHDDFIVELNRIWDKKGLKKILETFK